MASLLSLLGLAVSWEAGNICTGGGLSYGIRMASVALLQGGLLLRIHIQSLLYRGLLSLALQDSVSAWKTMREMQWSHSDAMAVQDVSRGHHELGSVDQVRVPLVCPWGPGPGHLYRPCYL